MDQDKTNQPTNDAILAALGAILEARKQQDPQDSYVASLYTNGLDKILEKVGEEATEVILASKNLHANNSHAEHAAHLVAEVADLWFHSLVMLHYQNLDASAVLAELASRFGISGHDEKASRGKS
ncbi:MAG: phosphoribosyl-ATP diphosphatase [Pseudomonadota bacterium]